jgi:hypothetical protein
LNRKVLASASIAAVLTAPVALAVADTNDTNTNPNHVPAGSTAQVSQEQRDIANVKQAAARSEMRRAEKAAKKAKAKKRAKKRAKLARKQSAAGAPQAASGQQASGGSVAPANLQAIAACESGGNPSAVGGGGAYRGKYQFDQGTWASVGGSGDPAAASEAEQDQRAAMLYSRTGASSWPVCGQ